MLKQLTQKHLEECLADIAQQYNLQVPQLLADGTRQLGSFGRAAISFFGAPLQRKPTDYFFPQTEQMVVLSAEGDVAGSRGKETPLALFGLDAADLAGVAFLDRFFSAPPADDLYLNKRRDALLIGLTGVADCGGRDLPLAQKHCDFEVIWTGERWLAAGYSEQGCKWLDRFPHGRPELLTRVMNSVGTAEERHRSLKEAGRLLREDKIPDSFWEDIADRCILCTGCNLTCPTCSCFCVQDRQTETGTVRSRVWDSCQLDAFMREASGHNPLGTEALRTRRRIHHKLVADAERWGEIGCVGCGRCDRACPTGIGMFAVVEEMLKRFADQK